MVGLLVEPESSIALYDLVLLLISRFYRKKHCFKENRKEKRKEDREKRKNGRKGGCEEGRE